MLKNLQNSYLSLSKGFKIIDSTIEKFNRGTVKVAEGYGGCYTFKIPWI